jgi:hypothetical protein
MIPLTSPARQPDLCECGQNVFFKALWTVLHRQVAANRGAVSGMQADRTEIAASSGCGASFAGPSCSGTMRAVWLLATRQTGTGNRAALKMSSHPLSRLGPPRSPMPTTRPRN